MTQNDAQESTLGKPRSINEFQIGGTHYQKLDPAPWDVITAWNLGYLDGTALKYIARWRDKGGLEDIRKAIHFLQKFIEVETEKQASAVSGAKHNGQV